MLYSKYENQIDFAIDELKKKITDKIKVYYNLANEKIEKKRKQIKGINEEEVEKENEKEKEEFNEESTILSESTRMEPEEEIKEE